MSLSIFHNISKPGSFWKTIMIASAASVGVGVGAFSLHDGNAAAAAAAAAAARTDPGQTSNKNQQGQQYFGARAGTNSQCLTPFSMPTSTFQSLASSRFRNFMCPKTVLCSQASPQEEEIPINNGGESAAAAQSFDVNTYGGGDPTTYFFEKMRDPPRNLVDSHAIFGALLKPYHIERYDTYRRVPLSASKKMESVDTASTEVCVADVRIGEKLNGHDNIVHGGIISLMLDDTFGWGYEAMCWNQGLFSLYTNAENGDLPYVVTANLTVNYRAPLPAGSNVVIRVRHEKTDGRKIYFSARMESYDGSVLYSEATALFITVKKEYLKN